MPLSEIYPVAKGKCGSTRDNCSNDLSFIPENDFVELVWENGQLMMQTQSCKARKNYSYSNSVALPSHETEARVKDIGNVSNNSRTDKFWNVDSVFDGSPFSVPNGELGLNEDEDVVPWFNYTPIDGSSQHIYGSDILPEASGVTGNETYSQNTFPSIVKRCSSNQGYKDLHFRSLHNHMHTEEGRVSKVSVAPSKEPATFNVNSVQLYPFSSIQCQKSLQNSPSKVSDSTNNCTSSASHLSVSRELTRTPAPTDVPCGMKLQKQSPAPIQNNSSLINFSHFARPPVLHRTNFQHTSPETDSGISTNKDKGSAVINSVPTDTTVVHSNSGLRKEANSNCEPIPMQSKVDSKPSEPKGLDAKRHEPSCKDDATVNNNKKSSELPLESSNKRPVNGEKPIEPVEASSSVCSGNSVEKIPDDCRAKLKRKCHDTEESACRSEDVEAESERVKKMAPRASNGSKRSRAAEVHNLSERRRRDKINEKMRALQELIPNCNKVDKASMLDEAIEYLKTLQLQVQIMSMGAGMYMPSMMLPTGMQHLNPAHMAHFLPMGVGMGMGFGMGMLDMTGGSSGCPMVQIPSMQGAHLSSSPMLGPHSLQGMPGSGTQMFGNPGQGFPMSMPQAQSIPFSGGPHTNLTMGLNDSVLTGQLGNLGPNSAASPRDPTQNINSQLMRSTVAGSSEVQTSN